MLHHEALGKRQRALEILGRLPLPGAESLLLTASHWLQAGELPLALWLDLFEAATVSTVPD